MKKLFTLALFSVFAVAGLQAQNFLEMGMRSMLPAKSINFKPTAKKLGIPTSTSRANVESFSLDYMSSDNFDADFTQQVFNQFIWGINSNYKNSDFLTLGFGAVIFDSLLINLYNSSGSQVGTTYVPLANTTLTLDSFDLFFNQTYSSSSVDTLKLSVFNANTLTVTGTGPAGVMGFSPVWDTVIYVNSAYPLLPGSTNFANLTIRPNFTFPTGSAFGIRVDYKGDTANKFNLLAGYKESCNDSFGGNPSVVRDNSLYYVNAIVNGSTNLSGINTIGFNNPTCREFYIQNFYLPVYVTTPLNFVSPITAEVKTGCPGTTSQLSTFPLGSDSLSNATFAWSVVPPSAGTLDDPSAVNPLLTFGNTSGRVVLTVTDDNGNTTTSSDSFSVRSINIAIAANPITLSCGSTTSIPCTISGYTVGAESYAWSTGPLLASPTLTGVNAPGTYTVTVTNSVGCTATASTVVQYPGGLSNTVNFTVPSQAGKSYICQGTDYTFTNTSSRTNGWVASWTFPGGNVSNLLDGTNNFSSIGNVQVVLSMDSANCKFTATKPVSVRNCTDINALSFDKAVAITPNPTAGNVTIEVTALSSTVNVSVFNILGAEVRNFTEEINGTLVKSYNLSDLNNGAYIVRIKAGNQIATKRLLISK